LNLSRLSTEFSQESAYQQAIRRLTERINYEKIGHPTYSDANYRLDRMRKLLGRLGDPHLSAPVIHIAGTKGKGSTAHLIAQMLSAAGYRTGLYTSPHLLRLEERFRINNRPCSPSDFISLVEQTQVAADEVEGQGVGRATFFELTTALACLYFAQQKAQVVVLEVGLGGRLDSTNVCQPIVSVITSIGLDHQAQLGNTIAEIAAEKAGIIKTGVPVISSARHPDAKRVIEATVDRLRAPLRSIERDFDCTWQALSGSIVEGTERAGIAHTGIEQAENDTALTVCPVARCSYMPHYPDSLFGDSTWLLSLLGAHQRDNLAAALATIDTLVGLGWQIPSEVLPAAVEQTTVSARLEIVAHRPWRLIDTAHNPDSIAATMTALDDHFPDRPRAIVLATSRDKDVEGMLRSILGRCQRLFLSQYHNNPRGLPIEELAAAAARVALQFADDRAGAAQRTQIFTAETPAQAWQMAAQLATRDEVICATGSFFQAAELLSA
jgi:dihydrofolate synthase/folylpolyglutamate synthase